MKQVEVKNVNINHVIISEIFIDFFKSINLYNEMYKHHIEYGHTYFVNGWDKHLNLYKTRNMLFINDNIKSINDCDNIFWEIKSKGEFLVQLTYLIPHNLSSDDFNLCKNEFIINIDGNDEFETDDNLLILAEIVKQKLNLSDDIIIIEDKSLEIIKKGKKEFLHKIIFYK